MIFQSILWLFLAHHYFSWHRVTFDDLLWPIMTFHDIFWLFMTHHDFSWYYSIITRFLINLSSAIRLSIHFSLVSISSLVSVCLWENGSSKCCYLPSLSLLGSETDYAVVSSCFNCILISTLPCMITLLLPVLPALIFYSNGIMLSISWAQFWYIKTNISYFGS